jgi:hypothetical protein
MLRAILMLSAAVEVLRGGVIVTFAAEKSFDGFSWDYTLTARNRCMDCPVSGLLVLRGDTAFALMAASDVTPPDGWDYNWPVPGAVDDLSFFSKMPAADLKKGGELEFKFNSITPPGSLKKPEDLRVDVICRDTGEQVRARSTLVPEPRSAVLALGALIGLAWRLRSRPGP